MESSLYNNHQFEEIENSSSDNSTDGSPPSTTRASVHPISFPKTRRGIQKRVVTVPLKGDYTSTTPPSDSWAWRKYGQKPIKGSPYPRGYYRCSSSKGCPARKQVERSRSDPSLLLVTYSYDHNHSFPVSRNHPNAAAASTATPPGIGLKIEEPNLLIESTPAAIPNNSDNNNQHLIDEKFADLTGDVESLITATDDFDWTFANMETTSSAILDDPIFSNTSTRHDLSYIPAMGEEEESLFADLGELPECSVVFGGKAEDDRRRLCGFEPPAPWCESTG